MLCCCSLYVFPFASPRSLSLLLSLTPPFSLTAFLNVLFLLVYCADGRAKRGALCVCVGFYGCLRVSVCVRCSSDPLISVRRNRGRLVLPSRVRGRVESAITLSHWDTHTFPGLHAQWGICLRTDSLVYNSPALNTQTHTGIDRKAQAMLYLSTVWLHQPQVSLSAVSHLSQPCRHNSPSLHTETCTLWRRQSSMGWKGSSWPLWCTG